MKTARPMSSGASVGWESNLIYTGFFFQLRKRLKHSKVKVQEDLDVLQRLRILIDYDDDGYLLQVSERF